MWNPKLLFLLSVVAIVIAKESVSASAGGQTLLSGDALKSAIELLSSALEKLSATNGPNYKISKVIFAKSQVVSGIIYRYKTYLTDLNNNSEGKICRVEIWSQSWLENGNQISLKCYGEEAVVMKYSSK